MTKHTLVKVEYVTQQYDENWTNPWTGGPSEITEGQFSGVVLEAVISF